MSASLVEMPHFFESDVVRLSDNEVFFGILSDIIEPDGEGFVLACIDGWMIEAPKELSLELWKLQGKKIVIGNVAGKHRVGVAT